MQVASPAEKTRFMLDPMTLKDKTMHTPEWVKNAVFYQIFPDRFAKSDRVAKASHLEPWDAPPTTHGYKGGDLLGVAERLDYLQDLGVTALYFNPVFQSGSNHRYHTTTTPKLTRCWAAIVRSVSC